MALSLVEKFGIASNNLQTEREKNIIGYFIAALDIFAIEINERLLLIN